MEEIFLRALNISLVASWGILAVLVIRLVFKKMPKWAVCLLWGLIAIRLVFPFLPESAISLIPSAKPLPDEFIYTAHPQMESGVPIIDKMMNPLISYSLEQKDPAASVNKTQVWSFILSVVWLAGIIVMFLYALLGTMLLKQKLATATLLKKGMKQSERIGSPFVLGLVKPVIYLPYGLKETDIDYVVAHEQAHIRRKDHWWKLFGFLLLSIYWFHPMMWIAYVFFCKDIEAACDEKVIKEMSREDRRAYSTALINCSAKKSLISACPIAFGETSIKSRIRGVMNYKKPGAFWMVATVIICCAIVVCFLTNPKEKAAAKETGNHQVIDAKKEIAAKYLYEHPGFGGDFMITLKEDGTAFYYEGGFSSHLGIGTWTIEGTTLSITEDPLYSGKERINCFEVGENCLVWKEEGSTGFIYIKIKDGDCFYAVDDANEVGFYLSK